MVARTQPSIWFVKRAMLTNQECPVALITTVPGMMEPGTTQFKGEMGSGPP